MPDGGKGSKPRPFSVDQKTFGTNWDKIFKSKKEKKQIDDYQDILSTEDCFLETLNKMKRDDL